MTGSEDGVRNRNAGEPAARSEPIIATIRDGHVELPNGRKLDVRRGHPPAHLRPTSATVLDEIEPHHFDVCPICLDAPPTTAEHVPPQSLGGIKLTSTCELCNNRFGSFEAEVGLHFRSGLRAPAFTGDGFPGRRRAGGIKTVVQEDGTPVWVIEAADPAIAEMLAINGRIDLTYAVPRPSLWRTALLKHAYLAACVYLRDIPRTEDAHQVRTELLAARDAGLDHELGGISAALPVARIFEAPQHPVYIASVDEPSGSRRVLIGLGTYGLAGWPLPRQTKRLAIRLAERSAPT